jgi:aspartate kinase
MTRLVLKFGGTSMGSPERIAHSASIVAAEAAKGHQVAVVVSAMAGETDRYLAHAQALGGGLGEIETDTVLAAGEQAAAALMALALKQLGLKARSVLAWQLPIEVDGVPGSARITGIDGEVLEGLLTGGVIPVVAGYQGVDAQGRLVTLGRGGTDLSAAAIAAALGADCDIYTDVDGVFTTDPRIESKATRLERISHDEMLELAAMGAKVLQTRSVEYAKAKGVAMRVKSSFAAPGQSAGTEVLSENALAERRVVSGIAYARAQARIAVPGIESSASGPGGVFAALAEAGVHVDMIVQGRARAGGSNLEFSVEGRELRAALHALSGRDGLSSEVGLAKVSVVGTGLRGRADVARTLYGVLEAEAIDVRMLATSEIKISALVNEDALERAVRALHAAYRLDEA